MAYFPRKMRWILHDYARSSLDYRVVQWPRPSMLENEEEKAGSPSAANPAKQTLSNASWERRLSVLPDNMRQTVEMRYYNDLTTRQIAQASGRTQRSVNRELRAAISILRQDLEDEQESCP